MSELNNSNRGDGENSRRYKTPAEGRPGQPSIVSHSAGIHNYILFVGRQRQRDYFSAIAATGEMLHHMIALASG